MTRKCDSTELVENIKQLPQPAFKNAKILQSRIPSALLLFL